MNFFVRLLDLLSFKPNFKLDYVVVEDFEVGPDKVHVSAADGKNRPDKAAQ